MSISFAKIGSLYYSSDLDDASGCVLVQEDGTELEEPRFTIGPSTGRDFIDDGRITLHFDRGPCKAFPSKYTNIIY